MRHDIKNIEASVKARLKNIAKDKNINFNQILLLYFQERLLYRLSISNYKENFFLKGGLLILSLTEFKTRPTKDIDFLACGVSNYIGNIEEFFREICNVQVNDGVTFDSESIVAERIAEGADYRGVRINVKSYLGNARRKLQLDIGFNDIIIPKPQKMNYPVFLNDQKRPKIKTYSLESVIAEKFEAMLRLSFINSRMKDFYDIYIISEIRNFDGMILKEAISRTIHKRKTPLEKNPAIFTKKFIEDTNKIRMWNGYLNRIRNDRMEFAIVIKRIKSFLNPIYISILEKKDFLKTWNHQKYFWD